MKRKDAKAQKREEGRNFPYVAWFPSGLFFNGGSTASRQTWAMGRMAVLRGSGSKPMR